MQAREALEGRICEVPPIDEVEKYAFLGPAQVLRGSHLILVFKFGKTEMLLLGRCKVARQLFAGKEMDWVDYCDSVSALARLSKHREHSPSFDSDVTSLCGILEDAWATMRR